MAVKQLVATSPKKTMQPHPDLEKFIKNVQGRWAEWVYQIKHDGVRCLYDPIHSEFYSRAAKVYPNFGLFKRECDILAEWLSYRVGYTVHLDGEMAGPNFTRIMNVLFKKDDNINLTGILYHVFDFTAVDMTFTERDELLTQAFTDLEFELLRPVFTFPMKEFTDFDQIERFIRDLEAMGLEGCVFKRKDSLYLHGSKKITEWVKGVLDETIDLPVVDVIEGEGKLKGCVGKFVCPLPDEFGDEFVKVAPGRATHAELKLWWENPEERPSMIEVFYKQATKDNANLRHPRFVRVREDK